jgi:hypothetical protein
MIEGSRFIRRDLPTNGRVYGLTAAREWFIRHKNDALRYLPNSWCQMIYLIRSSSSQLTE